MSGYIAIGQELARFSRKLLTQTEKFGLEVNTPARDPVFDILNRLGISVKCNIGSKFINVHPQGKSEANKIIEFVNEARKAEANNFDTNNTRFIVSKPYYQAVASLYSSIVHQYELGRIELDLEARTIDIDFDDENGLGILQSKLHLLSNSYNSGLGLAAITQPQKAQKGIQQFSTSAYPASNLKPIHAELEQLTKPGVIKKEAGMIHFSVKDDDTRAFVERLVSRKLGFMLINTTGGTLTLKADIDENLDGNKLITNLQTVISNELANMQTHKAGPMMISPVGLKGFAAEQHDDRDPQGTPALLLPSQGVVTKPFTAAYSTTPADITKAANARNVDENDVTKAELNQKPSIN